MPAVFIRLLGSLIVILCLPLLVCAQQTVLDKRLDLSVTAQQDICRGHAPLSLAVTLKWAAPELLEGDLQLEWFADTTRLGRCVMPDLALAESSLKLSVMLPPVMLSHDDSVCSVQGRFVTDAAVYDLDVHDVALQPDWRRVLLVGVCGDPAPPMTSGVDFAADENRTAFSEAFNLTPFFTERFAHRELHVDQTSVEPAEVPTDPLRMTAFDLFVIPGESIAQLKPAHLECLRLWTQAGGSLCVIVDAAVPSGHVEWLNRLAGRDAENAAYLADSKGHVVPANSNTGKTQEYFVGLGRTVVVLDQPELDSDIWKQAVLFLWKVRADRLEEAIQGGTWTLKSIDPPSAEAYDPLARLRSQAGRERFVDLQPDRIWKAHELEQWLLPDSVRGLPLRTVGLILVLFLLAIAPGDYLMLGWLRRRSWTWVLFPVVSLLFTAVTMWTADRHLGQTSYRQSITIIDVGADGQPVRTSEVTLLFTASHHSVRSEEQSSLMVPVDSVLASPRQRQRGQSTERRYEQPWIYTGQMPRAYTVSRDIQQWEPRLARVTKFHEAAEDHLVSTIDWDLVQAEDPQGLHTYGPAHVLHMSSDEMRPLFPEAPLVSPEVIEFAAAITRRPTTGLFSVVSQLSPTCAGNWEDLNLLDPSNPNQEVLLVISSPSEGQYIICRKLLTRKDEDR